MLPGPRCTVEVSIRRTHTMNIMIWIVAGGILGWIGYSAMHLNVSIGKMPAILLGAMAAFLGGKEVAPIFSAAAAAPGGFSPSALFFALATAAAILVAAHMVQGRFN